MSETAAICHKGTVAGPTLDHILGSWAWLCLLRRPAFSIFSQAYRQARMVRENLDDSLHFKLWPSVIVELRNMLSLAPLLSIKLNAPWSADLFATDASTAGQGVVRTQLRAGEGSFLHAYHGRDPSTPSSKESLLPLGKKLQRRPWHTIISSRWKYSAHINQLEFQALIAAIKRALQTRVGQRVPVLTDSAAVLGAASKGRSSSPLLYNCRRLAAYCFGGDLRLTLLWISTDFNPADHPSRVFSS
jgi:hypothetical protein